MRRRCKESCGLCIPDINGTILAPTGSADRVAAAIANATAMPNATALAADLAATLGRLVAPVEGGLRAPATISLLAAGATAGIEASVYRWAPGLRTEAFEDENGVKAMITKNARVIETAQRVGQAIGGPVGLAIFTGARDSFIASIIAAANAALMKSNLAKKAKAGEIGPKIGGAVHTSASAGASSVSAADNVRWSSPLRTKAPQILVFCCKKRCNRSLKKRMVLRPAYHFYRREDFFNCISTCLSSRECIFNPKNPFGEVTPSDG